MWYYGFINKSFKINLFWFFSVWIYYFNGEVGVMSDILEWFFNIIENIKYILYLIWVVNLCYGFIE